VRDLSGHIAGWLELVGSLGDDGSVWSEAGVSCAVSGIPGPMLNGGVAGPSASLDAVEQALSQLRASGLPWSWFVLPQTPTGVIGLVVAAGASEYGSRAPWMEGERAALPAPEVPVGIETREALEEADVRVWAETLQQVYQTPDASRDSWIAAARRRDTVKPQFRLWTLLSASQPIAITLGFVADGIVAQLGVGVVPGERGRGYGRLVTLIPPAELEAPIAGQWASPDGERLYRRLGMIRDGWVMRYLGGVAGW
jgi:hypothetical protein